VYVDKGISNIRLGMSLEIMTTIGAVLGGFSANYLPGDVLKKIFSIFLAAMGILMWYRSRSQRNREVEPDPAASIQGSYYDSAEGKTVSYSVRRLPSAMSASFVAGNISGLLGVGGGILKVPVMNLFCGVPMKAAAATSNFMIGVTAVASAFIYFSYGNVHPVYTAAAVLGVLGGSILGTRIGARIRSQTILAMFIVVLFIVAVRMFFQ